MNLSKTLTTIGLAASLALVGCKKTDDTASTAADKSASKPADPGAAAPTPTPAMTATPPAAPAPSAPGAAVASTPAAATVTIASDDEYMTKGTAMIDKLFALFQAAGTNCDQLADTVEKFADENGATIRGLDAYERAHADAKRKFDEATKTATEKFATATAATMKACKDNSKLGAAIAKMGG